MLNVFPARMQYYICVADSIELCMQRVDVAFPSYCYDFPLMIFYALKSSLSMTYSPPIALEIQVI